jgi:hypothetical protein
VACDKVSATVRDARDRRWAERDGQEVTVEIVQALLIAFDLAQGMDVGHSSTRSPAVLTKLREGGDERLTLFCFPKAQ